MESQPRGRWNVALVGVAVLAALAGSARSGSAQSSCLGDCDGNGTVDISDLITGVNIVLGNDPISVCPAFDNGSGVVTVDVLITAVNNALSGMPADTDRHRHRDPHGYATASATGTPPATATVTGTVTSTATITDTPGPSNTPTETPTITVDADADRGALPVARIEVERHRRLRRRVPGRRRQSGQRHALDLRCRHQHPPVRSDHRQTAGGRRHPSRQSDSLRGQSRRRHRRAVSDIDTPNPTVSDPVQVGSEPTGLALSPSGDKLFVAEWAEGRVSELDTVGGGDRRQHRERRATRVRLVVTNDGDRDDDDETLIVTEFYGEPNPDTTDCPGENPEVCDTGRIGRVRRYDVADLSPQSAIVFQPIDSGFAPSTEPPGAPTVMTSPNAALRRRGAGREGVRHLRLRVAPAADQLPGQRLPGPLRRRPRQRHGGPLQRRIGQPGAPGLRPDPARGDAPLPAGDRRSRLRRRHATRPTWCRAPPTPCSA